MARIYYIGAAKLPFKFPRCAPRMEIPLTKAKGIIVYVYDVHCISKCFPLKIMVTKTQMMVFHNSYNEQYLKGLRW